MALTVSVVGCSSDGVSATTCDEIVDETIELYQSLIDFVDDELEGVSVDQFLASEGDLPSLEEFADDAEEIDAIAADLECTQTEVSSAVDARLGELTSTTELGQFIINALRSGGI
jgi:hypothetical protein